MIIQRKEALGMSPTVLLLLLSGAGKKSAFVYPLLQKQVHGVKTGKNCITCFFGNLPVLHRFRCNTLAGPIENMH